MLFALALMAAGCGSPAGDRGHDIQQIKDNEAQWNQDYAAKDVDKLAGYYSDGAVLMLPGAPPVTGKDPIHNALRQMVSDPAFALHFEASQVDVAASSDLAFTQGSYTYTSTDPQSKSAVTAHGSYVTTFRRNSGGMWKAVADIATPDAAAGGMK
jgi:ketosteroid isomerase-like protein